MGKRNLLPNRPEAAMLWRQCPVDPDPLLAGRPVFSSGQAALGHLKDRSSAYSEGHFQAGTVATTATVRSRTPAFLRPLGTP